MTRMIETELVSKEDVLQIIKSPLQRNGAGLLHGDWEPQEVVEDYAEKLLYEVKKLKSITSSNQWISVEDRLPDKNEVNYDAKWEDLEVIVMIGQASVPTVLRYDGKQFMDFDGRPYAVSYWQYLPTPPPTKE